MEKIQKLQPHTHVQSFEIFCHILQVKCCRMSDDEDHLDLYPSNDEEFAGENMSSKHSSPYKAVSTKVSTARDDERSEDEDADKSSQGMQNI